MKLRQLAYWIVTVTLTCQNGVTQPRFDSLARALDDAVGQSRVDVLNRLAFEYIARDNQAAQDYCTKAIELAIEWQYPKGHGEALIYRGVSEYLAGEFRQSRVDLNRGLSLIKGKYKDIEGYAYLQLGNSYMNQTLLDSSLHFYSLSYSILKDSSNPSSLSKLYKNMGTLYGLRSDPTRQRAYLKKSLRIRERLGDKQLMTDVLVELGKLNAQSLACDSAHTYLNKAQEILKTNLSDRENLSDLQHARSLCLFNEGRLDEAFTQLDSALTYYRRAGLTLKEMFLQMDLGAMLFNQGAYELSLKNYYAALRIAESKSYHVEKLDINVRLGWVHYQLGDLKQALEFASHALLEARKINLQNRVGNALTLMGVTLTESRDFDRAHTVLAEALAIRERSADPVKISEGYLNLGYMLERVGKYKEAFSAYRQSIAYAEPTNYRMGMAWSFLGLGNIAFHEHDYTSALNSLVRAEEIARSINANEILIRIYTTKRDIFNARGLLKESLRYAMRADAMKDSLHRGDLARRFANLQKMNEIESRDEDIKALEQERLLTQEKIRTQQATLRQQYVLIIGAILGGLLLGAVAIIYARYFFRVRKLNRTIQEKNESIQLNSDRLAKAKDELELLYRAVTEQKEEIQAQAEELTESHAQVSELNENLNRLIVEKTQDLRAANDELIKQYDDLQQFSYSLSHNLRGPVARIMGLATLLQNQTQQSEIQNLSRLVLKTSNDLDQVLRDLSKIIDVKNELHRAKELVNLKEEWDLCVQMLADTIPPSANLVANFTDIPAIFTVRAIIHSTFSNLLSNSIKYRSSDRILSIRADIARDRHLVIQFEDNGLGVDLEKYRDSIFKLFKRFHAHVEGRGMGLYLVKTQVESLGGSIIIESTPGDGTRFKILLPLTVVPEIEVSASFQTATHQS